MKFTRKDLPPDQMKRANITTCLTVTMAYVFYILIMLTSDRTTLEKIIFILCDLVCADSHFCGKEYL